MESITLELTEPIGTGGNWASLMDGQVIGFHGAADSLTSH